MKKLAIMFVMLLGSVATMQAQSFDFSCADVVEGVDASGMDSFPDAEEMILINMNIVPDFTTDDAFAGFSEDVDTPGVYSLSFDDGDSAIEIGLRHLGDVELPYQVDGEDLPEARTHYATLQDALDYIGMTYIGLFQTSN